MKIFEDLGFSASELWGELAVAALKANGIWLDGKAFFVTTRNYSDGTNNSPVVNKTTSAFSETAFKTAYKTMRKYKAHNGKQLKVKPDLLIVGVDNEDAAKNILKNSFTYDATDKVQIENLNKNLVDLIVLPELDSEWFLVQTRGVLKPIAVQKRIEPNKIIRKDKDEDDNVFERDEYHYGVRGRGRAFLTMPHLAYGGFPS